MKLETLNNELSELFQTAEFENNGGIHITGTEWYTDDLRIELAIETGLEGESQFWEVQINGVRKELIKSSYTDKIELFNEHPLLWEYNQEQSSLYFGNKTGRPYELFANIYKIHMLLTNSWIPFEEYVNTGFSIVELCKSTTGLFAKGPINILKAYKGELEIHEMKPTIIGGYYPQEWSNEQNIDEVELNVLIIGESYVVAETFDFTRV